MSETRLRIRPDELLDLGDYERARDEIRRAAMAARNLRRVLVGPNVSLSFESRQTVLYQIQEILRAERIAKPEAVAEEANAYAHLLPAATELAATLMFEFPDPVERDRRLAELVGIEKHLAMHVGKAHRASAGFDPGQIDSRGVSAVQFVRFQLNGDLRRAMESEPSEVVIDHPKYPHRATLSPELVRALLRDMKEAA